MTDKIYIGDAIEVLKTLPDESVQCCVTSPPYYGLRDYGVVGQLGLEKTPEDYVSKMVEVFREVKRVLRNDGTLWLNIGDSYSGSFSNKYSVTNKNSMSAHAGHILGGKEKATGIVDGLKAKDLIGIPWRLAFALQSDGWWLRQDIIWSKPNPMPESVTDRCTKAHEYIFLLSKSARYYYDNEAIKEETNTFDLTERDRDLTRLNNTPGRTKMAGLKTNQYEMRNCRSVWSITTQPYKEAHFAVFPEKIPLTCIKAACPEKGIVLDPFAGSGTVGKVARDLNRHFILIELNEKYIEFQKKRSVGLFCQPEVIKSLGGTT